MSGDGTAFALSDDQREGYLARLGLTDRLGAAPADLEMLTTVHRAHLGAVPFENLDIRLGRPIVLDLEQLVDKLIGRRRGGFCYELNGALSALLRSLGFSVRLLEAQVYGPSEPIRFDHLCLLVDLDQPYLVDVGFGRAFDEPLLMTTRLDQLDPAGTFRLDDTGDGWMDLVADGTKAYRLSLDHHTLDHFESGCVHHQTSSLSPFTQSTVCSRRTATGHITVSGDRFIETIDGIRHEEEVDAGALDTILRELFQVTLSADELERLIALQQGGS